MSKVIFVYKNQTKEIKCEPYESMKWICNKFIKQLELDINKINFKYDGKEINGQLLFRQLINEKDKVNNIIKISVYDINNKNDKKYENKQNKNNIIKKDFENSNNKDLSKNEYKRPDINNKNNTYKNEPYSNKTTPHSSRIIKNNEIEFNKKNNDSIILNNTQYIYKKNQIISEPLKENKKIVNEIKKNPNGDIKNKNYEEILKTNNKINDKNYIIGEIEIEDKNLDKNFRIINSFEEFVK